MKNSKLIHGIGGHFDRALESLCNQADASNFEAVVGVRFAFTPNVRSAPSGITSTSEMWTAYGTAVSY